MGMLVENMQVFVRVVELGSLSAAGRHLRLSPAVVSHRLQQLEGHLGVRLLNRTTRQVQPTEQGAAFYEAATGKGAQFLTEPLDRKAELRCYLRDPDGHLIEVGQATGMLEGVFADPPADSG